jgi:chemotaxis protein histidine kinase CheA
MNTAAPDRLLALKRRFLDGVERRLADMSTELDRTADTDALMRMFHSLAGIGGTYGFPRVSEISRRCESLCAGALEGKRALLSKEKITLHLGVASIRGITASTSPRHPEPAKRGEGSQNSDAMGGGDPSPSSRLG